MFRQWLALETGADPAERAGAVRRAHEAFLAGGAVGAPVRGLIADSWRRSARASVAVDHTASVDLDDDDLAAHRREHPLGRVMPLFRELLGGIAEDGAHLLSVCDEQGRMLWVEGHADVRRRAERMNFVPGARWSEPHAGTNAPGTALALGHPVQIFAAEHYCRPVQPWTCAAAPVHDPRTRRVLGAVDITGGDHLASPHSLALVQATARAAEAQLASLLPAAAPVRLLEVLGRDGALLHTGRSEAPVRLGARHSEIVLLLASHPDGLSGGRLALELYGERDVSPVTLRAELSRLRGMLGPLLASRPYRLTARMRTDCDTVAEALDTGDLPTALAAYRGPLLPLSEAPGVARIRRMLEDRLRRALIVRRDPELLDTWVRTPWGEEDLEVWEALVGALPPAARAVPGARLRALREACGIAPPRGPGVP
ncbi:GAF domain-containing protein [Streptomyces verrucosisporus]|uniref:helix-turn-helix domain-containing protein n=1 Tax=Streptomyces verrucosisporus TaxID=1695161 RepID=UPI0019D1F73D|nr:helix-turn-helix domain-containing protein [Streptomyces verrucosisporus]MBN3931334.1 GAF domain-containing protein [Streptomyces verrucosisporus]